MQEIIEYLYSLMKLLCASSQDLIALPIKGLAERPLQLSCYISHKN
jgi:hypothetical protein